MSYGEIKKVGATLRHLVHVNPKAAREAIVLAIKAAGFERIKAATLLGVGYSTLFRWIHLLKMDREVETLIYEAEKSGKRRANKGGRPKSSATKRMRTSTLSSGARTTAKQPKRQATNATSRPRAKD